MTEERTYVCCGGRFLSTVEKDHFQGSLPGLESALCWAWLGLGLAAGSGSCGGEGLQAGRKLPEPVGPLSEMRGSSELTHI